MDIKKISRKGKKKFSIHRYILWIKSPYAIVIIVIVAIFSLRPQITGFVVKTEASGPGAEFTDIINVSYTHSNQYNWIPENLGNISYIKLSGWFAGNGSV